MFYLKERLAAIGVADKDAKLYIAALEMGEAPVHLLAKRTGITRTTAYDVLDRLVKDGLVTRHKKQGRIHVVAEPPEQLLKRYEVRVERLREIVPDLKALHLTSSARPHIRLYEGKSGISTVINNGLKCKSGVMRACLSMAEVLEMPGFEVFDRFSKERIRLGIELRVIRAREEEVADIWRTDHSVQRELRYAPVLDSFSMTMFIYDDCVSLISSRRESFGLIIQNEEFARTQEYLFERLWQISETS